MGRGKEGVVANIEDGTDAISGDDKLETVVDNVVVDDDDDKVVVEVDEEGAESENDVDTDDNEVGKDGVNEDEVGGGGATEDEFDENTLTVMGTVTLVTAMDKEALLARLGSDILAALSALLGIIDKLALPPRDMPELPGVTPVLSSSTSPLSCCSTAPLELALLPPDIMISPSFPDGFTPGGRPVRLFSLGSLDSLSSSEAPASNGTGRYGGIVLTWLPFLSFEKWYWQ